VYNDGDNDWASNYYSDWKNNDPRSLSGEGQDLSPLIKKLSIKKVKAQYQAVSFDMNRQLNNYGQMESDGVIATSRLWKDMTVNYVSHSFQILSGATLTMENVTLNSPSMYNSEPEIAVRSGAILILKNSRIICDPLKMPIFITVEAGGTMIAEDCTFQCVNRMELFGADGTFKNCTFIDCYYSLYFGSDTNMKITNCKVKDSFAGISTYASEGSIVSGNTLTNVVLQFPEPVLVPVSAK
jgi:parallel beta-helix repeat protein